MKAFAHTLLKQNNSFLLLHHLYIKQSATMLDLVKETQLSQSSVRNMLRQFEEEGVVKSIGIDDSTGGRCPNRFSLNPNRFCLLCLFVHKEYMEYRVIKPYKLIEAKKVKYDSYETLIDLIKHFDDQYSLNSVVIAVEGIVNGYQYYTDHEDQYIENNWIEHLQHQINIPVYVDNDVKCMQRGIYKQDESLENFVYLYISMLGMGGSVMIDGTILNGHKGIVGEWGLIPYQGGTINQAIRECQSQKEFDTIILYLLTIVCTSHDPQKILITCQPPFNIDILELQKQLNSWVYQDYLLDIVQDPVQYLFDGLEYFGTVNLLKRSAGEQ